MRTYDDNTDKVPECETWVIMVLAEQIQVMLFSADS